MCWSLLRFTASSALTQNETFPACALFHVKFITVGTEAEGPKLIVPKLVIVFTINEEIGFSEPYKKTYASVGCWQAHY